jgi:hypothetical protein
MNAHMTALLVRWAYFRVEHEAFTTPSEEETEWLPF